MNQSLDDYTDDDIIKYVKWAYYEKIRLRKQIRDFKEKIKNVEDSIKKIEGKSALLLAAKKGSDKFTIETDYEDKVILIGIYNRVDNIVAYTEEELTLIK